MTVFLKVFNSSSQLVLYSSNCAVFVFKQVHSFIIVIHTSQFFCFVKMLKVYCHTLVHKENVIFFFLCGMNFFGHRWKDFQGASMECLENSVMVGNSMSLRG